MFSRNKLALSIKKFITFPLKKIMNFNNNNLISSLMKSTNNTKKKEKISIEYETAQSKANNTKKASESLKKETIYDSKMSLAETLLKDKSKTKNLISSK